MALIRRRSPWSLLFHERDIDVDQAKFGAWLLAWANNSQSTPSLQAMFPDIPAQDREFLFSGITPEERELDRLNAERAAQSFPPIHSLDEVASGRLPIDKRSEPAKVPGSIVFRDEDYFASPRIYADDYAKAAFLAAKYRNFCLYVDVLNAKDEIVHSWVSGVPGEGDEIAKALAERVKQIDLDQIDDEDGLVQIFEDRTFAVAALESAFATAIAPSVNSAHGLNVALERESYELYDATRKLDVEARAKALSNWLSDPDRMFLPALVEAWALNMFLKRWEGPVAITNYDVELANLEARNFVVCWPVASESDHLAARELQTDPTKGGLVDHRDSVPPATSRKALKP